MDELPSVPKANIWFVYILECSDSSYYVGFTSDLRARIKTHQSGDGPAYTAARLPLKLAFSESLGSMTEAIKREKQIKGWTHAKKAALARGDLQGLRALSQRRKSKSASPKLVYFPN